jgi:hypothetical protein
MPYSWNGIGTTYWGCRDKAADGSYVTTEFFCVGIPLIPLGSYRVLLLDSSFTGRKKTYRTTPVPLNGRQVLNVYLVTICVVAGIFLLGSLLNPPVEKGRDKVQRAGDAAKNADRIPQRPCEKGFGLKPDLTGFGPWTCQPLGTHAERAQANLSKAQEYVVQSRDAKGAALVQVLLLAEQAFRAAGTEFALDHDNKNQEAAYQEADRMGLIRFVEEIEVGRTPTREGCRLAESKIASADKANPQVKSLSDRIVKICETI